MNMHRPPQSIPEYLEQLRVALTGADPALVQDALYDAEEYLRSELAEQAGRSEAEVIASVASSYGAPDEVADIYRDTEVKVQTALRPPAPRPRTSLIGRFFGVAADPRTYASLFYMVLSLATGIFYFTWVVTGLSVSLSLVVVLIGIPLLILFFGSVRLLSLVEGRLVEVMLGERMPRRPLYSARGRNWLQRIGDMFTDARTWSTLLYLLLMLPLGIVYFTINVTLLSLSLSMIAAPLAMFPGLHLNVWMFGVDIPQQAPFLLPLVSMSGVLLLFASLHLFRAVGRMHGGIAKHLLVKTAQYS
ncbi:sensor domain-containing protein [Luteimonas sp. 3794]|uniref:sensor domain-containing protein n=1 Tax=Luteimonas sp. 3794 TaxID=2817730 RepID=UPI0028663DF6|nr:sensor domain-containing protein [Luteimonas sp. 3794]MDR6992009.1 putative membrane protein [Luteimonas sp. 3794]